MARRFNAAENIGPSVPPARLKSALNNDRIAAGHSIAGRCDRPPIDADSIDHRYGESTRFDVLDKAMLVQRAPLRKRFEERVPNLWLLQLTVRDLEIEFRQVATVEMPHQVSRAEIDCCPDLLHFLPRVDLSAESSIGSVYYGRYAILQSAAPRIALDIGEQSVL